MVGFIISLQNGLYVHFLPLMARISPTRNSLQQTILDTFPSSHQSHCIISLIVAERGEPVRREKSIARHEYRRARGKVPGNITIGVVFPNVGTSSNSDQKLRRGGLTRLEAGD